MKSLKTLMGLVAGGIGMLAGFGMFLAGCDDDNPTECNPDQYKVNGVCTDKTPNDPIDFQVVKCCGNDDGSETYKACVDSYKTTSVCASAKPNDPEPTVYGPAPFVPTKEEIKECCGNDDGSADYNSCVNDYMLNGTCSRTKPVEPEPTVYGPAPFVPTKEEIKECCGDDDDSTEYNSCVNDYMLNGTCSRTKPVEPEPTVYGPNPVDCCGTDGDTVCEALYFTKGICLKDPENAGLAECCGDKDIDGELYTCVKDYQETGSCADIDDPPMADYGMPPVSDEDIAKCCGKDKDADGYEECVSNYRDTGACLNADEPPATYYGPAPGGDEPDPES